MQQPSLVVLITGASAGIGAATARALAPAGCRLALAARRKDRLEELASELRSRHGTETLTLVTDVQVLEQVRAMVEAAHRHFGRLDVLINNAGVLRMAPVLAMPASDMEALMNTNFWPVVHAVRAAAPLMAAQGGGHIINVGSGVSRRGLPYMAVYSATKFALAGLTEGLRIELARDNIRFTTVYPGVIDTDMPRNVDRSRLPEDYPDHTGSRIPVERVAQAIAKAVRTKPVEVYVPGWMRYALWFCAMCPALADKLIGRHYKRRSPV
ncbi:MAG: SDR family NAD(P)-dependent oxidoreductase [Verrucomicrobiae bacterium]|nr:SDR family NAD(P)-dependent oxidoreductase [Verrucomicrobiae bacterium]